MSARLHASRLMLRRGRGIGDVLPILAFAASTGVLAMVLGGLGAFLGRAARPGDAAGSFDMAGFLVVCAIIATALLVPSAMSLGAAAARLSLSRRERQLAAVRLIGGTRSQVAGVAVIDVLAQAMIGSILGIGLHVAVIPVLTQLDFAIAPFGATELLLPWWGYPALLAGVALLSVGSALLGLVGVTISPLGVARQSRTVKMSALRLVIWVVVLVGFVVVTQVMSRIPGLDAAAAIGIMAVMMALVVGSLNVIGPFAVWVIARMVAAAAPTPALLVGARRLAADPRAGWRAVSGIAFGLVITGMLTLISAFTAGAEDPESRALATALVTGGYLTLAITAVLAAVGTGVTQTARLLEQGEVVRAQHVAGATVGQLHRARFAEIGVPLALAGVIAAISALVLITPVMSGMPDPLLPLALYVAASVSAIGLVALSVAASGPLVGRLARSQM